MCKSIFERFFAKYIWLSDNSLCGSLDTFLLKKNQSELRSKKSKATNFYCEIVITNSFPLKSVFICRNQYVLKKMNQHNYIPQQKN